MPRGPLALLGSGEFTAPMEALDVALLEGRPQRVVFMPTAAAQEGEERVQYWVDLGLDHFRRLSVEVEALMVLERGDADDDALAAKVRSAGLVYMSGGDPIFLARTLRGSAVGRAMRDAWEAGAAVAGCSAGAMVLASKVLSIRSPGDAADGLAYSDGFVVLPHFDRVDEWLPGAADRAVAAAPDAMAVLGVDEFTAAVGGPDRWRVYGQGSVALLRRNEMARRFQGGEEFTTAPGD